MSGENIAGGDRGAHPAVPGGRARRAGEVLMEMQRRRGRTAGTPSGIDRRDERGGLGTARPPHRSDRRHRAVARAVHGARVRGRPVAPRPRVRPDRATDLPVVSHRSRAGAALDRVRAVGARVQRRRSPFALRDAACPERPAVQRRRTCVEVAPSVVVQHRGQLHDQHELAELLPRVDDEPLHPDGRAHGPELRLRGRGYGGNGGAHPWPVAGGRSARSATSGSTSSAPRCGYCSPSRSCSQSSRWRVV